MNDFYSPQCPVTSEQCLGAEKCIFGCWIQKLPAQQRDAAVNYQRKALEENPVVGMRVGEWKDVVLAVSVNGTLKKARIAVTAAFVATKDTINFEIDRQVTFEFSKAGVAHIHVFRNGVELLVSQLDRPVSPGNAFTFGPAKN